MQHWAEMGNFELISPIFLTSVLSINNAFAF